MTQPLPSTCPRYLHSQASPEYLCHCGDNPKLELPVLLPDDDSSVSNGHQRIRHRIPRLQPRSTASPFLERDFACFASSSERRYEVTPQWTTPIPPRHVQSPKETFSEERNVIETKVQDVSSSRGGSVVNHSLQLSSPLSPSNKQEFHLQPRSAKDPLSIATPNEYFLNFPSTHIRSFFDLRCPQ